MVSLDEAVLDDKLAELERLRSWSPRVVSKLESFLRAEDEWALYRSNPFEFARERSIGVDESIDLFLMATKVGIFRMNWSLLCPGCGAAVQSFSSLRNVCATFHCFLCSTDVETKLDDYVQVSFTIAPQVRRIAAHEPARLSVQDFYFKYNMTREARLSPSVRFIDMAPKMVLSMAYLEPHETKAFEVQVEPGAMVVFDQITSSVTIFMINEQGPANALHNLRLQDGIAQAPLHEVSAGPLSITVTNDSEQRATALLFFKPQAVIDEAQQRVRDGLPTTMAFDPFLTGRRLLTSQTFRQAFGSEIIRSSDGIGVRDITILFTDLKGSTALYDRIGDLKAFALVNQHFDRLGRAIVRHRGAIVKTIGDAVMASFESPSDAMQAARDMLREIETFNDEVGEREIVLKVGVHRGASIAVTLNDRLDFFGQTINIAARVQGRAHADEIFITDEIFRAPGVGDVLSELHVTPQRASLKGIQRAVSVYRVATSPASAPAAQ